MADDGVRTTPRLALDTIEQQLLGGDLGRDQIRSATHFPEAVAMPARAINVGTGIRQLGTSLRQLFSNADEVGQRCIEAAARPSSTLTPGQRFNTLFFLLCSRAYIFSAGEIMSDVETKLKEATGLETNHEPDDPSREMALKDLRSAINDTSEAELTYMFAARPLQRQMPLFSSYDRWLTHYLATLGVPQWRASAIADRINKLARDWVRTRLAADEPASAWMRNYLAIDSFESVAQLGHDLRSVQTTLLEWRDSTGIDTQDSRRQAWDKYRQLVRELPDLSETMFNESFGVRKVFQSPAVTYHVNGMPGDAGTPQDISDVGSLLGALVSNRRQGGSLVVLAGGPGSGKSTLCRLFASELASTPGVSPVFVKLRRAREGEDTVQFIEDSLRREGLIDRSADLLSIPNLVVILDGFDELVMASRSRLRRFFNTLIEDISTGPLRNAKVVVSGRDTLFPRGEGLPNGSHVITLQPFDRGRIAAWGERWREQHQGGAGSDFDPIALLPSEREGDVTPLQQLLGWPLTLHLVARIHTAGHLGSTAPDDDVTVAPQTIKKAYLYRSILDQTSTRQIEQTSGEGRLDKGGMRVFLRALAWEMYIRGLDSMDVADVTPLLERAYASADVSDWTQLADIAIVNAPELTKGEETGFEFVHKSFSEFLVAEVLAETLERVAFKVQDFGTTEFAWRMSGDDATAMLATAFGPRLLPAEVQEMLEPMVGGITEFCRSTSVSDKVPDDRRMQGLQRVLERLTGLYDELISGRAAPLVIGKSNLQNPLEFLSNYAVGLVRMGSIAAAQARTIDDTIPLYNLEPFDGALWRLVGLMNVATPLLDTEAANRLFLGTSVRDALTPRLGVSDLDSPFKLSALIELDGFLHQTRKSVEGLLWAAMLEKLVFRIDELVHNNNAPASIAEERLVLHRREFLRRGRMFRLGLPGVEELYRAGLVARSTLRELEEFEHFTSRNLGEGPRSAEGPRVLFDVINELLYRLQRTAGDYDVSHDLVRYVFEIRETLEFRLAGPRRPLR